MREDAPGPAAGKHIVLVDMYGAFTADPSYRSVDLNDNLHPNATGCARMGEAWYGAPRDVLR